MRVSEAAARKMGLPVPEKKHKYNATPTVCGGIRFASAKEANRYGELQLLLKAGQIRELQLQYVFDLHVQNMDLEHQKIGKYVCDFVYLRDGAPVFEDVKGIRLPLYKWKKKHTEAEYGITIVEV